MSRFYETTILLDPPPSTESAESWGIQVLASPPTVNGEPINYEPLLQLLADQSLLRPIRVPAGDDGRVLATALAALADPEWNRRWAHIGEFSARGPLAIGLADPYRLEIGEYLLSEAPIAAETSPLSTYSIARLVGEAGTITYLFIAGTPALVITGAVGIVILRGLGAVGGALWRGAEPNVVRFGDDASAKVLDALRKRLNLDSSDDSGGDGDDISSAS